MLWNLRKLLRALQFCAALLLVVPSILVAQTAADCLGCHSESSLSTSKHGKTVSLFVDGKKFASSVHGGLECVACHEGFDPSSLPHKKKITPVNCLGCHAGERLEHYKNSVHASVKDGKAAAACSDCHTSHEIRKLTEAPIAERKAYAEQTCAKCHSSQDALYRTSDHGVALAKGVTGAPTCIDCHDEHTVMAPSDTTAKTSRRNVASMCMKCHVDNSEVREAANPSASFIASYQNSVHAKAVKNGKEEAATCIDCHGSHDLKKGEDPASRVSRRNIAETCGGCHLDIVDQYKQSIHGVSLANGVMAAATCTDCHGEHNILSPQDARSPVSAKNISAQVCSPCHASVKLTQKYGLAADRFQSFNDSYHGLANRAGSVEVANCASCHGVHDIKPSSDSTSRISPANLARTCGNCHPGANQNFTKGAVHIIATQAKGQEDILYYVSTGYIILIVLIVGGMLIHNILDFVKKSKRQLMYRRGIIQRPPVPHRLYLRMTLSERVQHGLLLASFITLVMTGFALRFPDAWWVASVRSVIPFMFEIRSVAHRVAAVVMVAASLYHLYYLFFVPRGKRLLRDLLPVPQDITDAVMVMKYNLGLSQERPRFGRFSYIEKSEYWALVWGTVVMGVTGVILWFDNTFLGLLTKLGWDIARTVHYYEAWLATLAIIVWHFYFVIFNPDIYPLNLAFWKGTLTEEEMEEEHPLELEEAHRKAAVDENVEDEQVIDAEAETEGEQK